MEGKMDGQHNEGHIRNLLLKHQWGYLEYSFCGEVITALENVQYWFTTNNIPDLLMKNWDYCWNCDKVMQVFTVLNGSKQVLGNIRSLETDLSNIGEVGTRAASNAQ